MSETQTHQLSVVEIAEGYIAPEFKPQLPIDMVLRPHQEYFRKWQFPIFGTPAPTYDRGLAAAVWLPDLSIRTTNDSDLPVIAVSTPNISEKTPSPESAHWFVGSLHPEEAEKARKCGGYTMSLMAVEVAVFGPLSLERAFSHLGQHVRACYVIGSS